MPEPAHPSRRSRRLAGRVTAVFALVVLWVAAAPADTREFTGRIDRVSDTQVRVDNRMGDEMTFVRRDATVIEGRRGAWQDLRAGDWVTVTWDMADRTATAHRVTVLPEREP